MKITHPGKVRICVPDGLETGQALQRCSHLGVGAHQDDLEIMAFHGVLECFDNPESWFGGVICTDGTGGPRKEGLEHLAPGEIGALRNAEQEEAARLGQYGAMVQLNYASTLVKQADKSDLIADLSALIGAAQPEVVYTHNPVDKHDTHVGVVVATLEAIRRLSPACRPPRLYGCEVWRDLDWLDDDDKVRLDVSDHERLAESLINCHASQITAAKRYDIATIGRRRANATYSDSHGDVSEVYVTYAMDLSPLVTDDRLSLQEFVAGKIRGFEKAVLDALACQIRR